MYVNRFDQRCLAWTLVDVAAPHLSDNDRCLLWVKIGAGDLETALFALVGLCMRNNVALSADVVVTLRHWLHGYTDTEMAAAFQPYIKPTPIRDRAPDTGAQPGNSRTTSDGFADRPRRTPVGSAR